MKRTIEDRDSEMRRTVSVLAVCLVAMFPFGVAWAQDDHGDRLESATLLAIGPPQIGTIDGADDLDYYRIDLAGSATVTVATAGPTDTRGELLAGNGALIASDDGSGPGGNNFQLTETLAAGVYYVAVSGSEGGYALTALLADAGDQGGTAASSSLLLLYGAAEVASVTSIASSALLSTVGTIDEAMADLDYFRIDVPRDGTDVVLRTPGQLDTAGRLLDSSLAEVASDEGVDGAFRIDTTLAAGTYYLEVLGHEAGRYRVVASGSDADCACAEEAAAATDHGGTAESSTLMPIGPPLTGEIAGGDDMDVFRIDLAGDATVVFETAGPTDTMGTLRDGAGTELATADAGGPAMNFGITEELAPGVYYLEVSGAAAGNYSVSALIGGDADHGDSAAQSTLLTLYSGDDVARVPQTHLSTVGSIDAAETDIDVFRLDVPQDMTDVTIRSAGTLDTFATLRDASLMEVAMDDGDGAFRIETTLDAGIYYVEVGGHESGRYRVLAWGDAHAACPCADGEDDGEDQGSGDEGRGGVGVGEPTRNDLDGDGVLNSQDAFPRDRTRSRPERGISATVGGQVLVSLAPDELGPSNLFDLNGKSVTFTPDMAGGLTWAVGPLDWDSDIGDEVGDGPVEIEGFRFPFAGDSHGSLHVSRQGMLTLGAARDIDINHYRFATMSAFSGALAHGPPTISPFFKPWFGVFGTARRHVRQWPDRVVVTWFAQTFYFNVFGVPPAQDEAFQTVLFPDGRVRFSYQHIANKDAIVGLFPNPESVRGEVVATLVDGADSELPGHLDIRAVTVYATNTDAFILEFSLGGPLRSVPAGSVDSYRLYVDTDPPLAETLFDDVEFVWAIDRTSGGVEVAWGPGQPRVLDSDDDSRIRLLAYVGDFAGGDVAVFATATEFIDRRFVQEDRLATVDAFLAVRSFDMADLSLAGDTRAARPHEVFHWPAAPDTTEIACRIIDVLGDEFDVLAFHSEFRIDSQEAASPFRLYESSVMGVGPGAGWPHDCSAGRLKGHYAIPAWARSTFLYDSRPVTGSRRYSGFTEASWHLAHELGHAWGAFVSFAAPGNQIEPLFAEREPCRCHWRTDLHTPAAFPSDPTVGEPSSTMDGRFWKDNGDGTWTPTWGTWWGGFSWFDLYLMGLADPSEVPDTFLLRNIQPAGDVPGHLAQRYSGGNYTARREPVKLAQVIAAEGPRRPAYPQTQSVLNAAFVYLPRPGESPDADLLDLHARYVENTVAYWSRITGGRSTLTTRMTFAGLPVFVPRPPIPDEPAGTTPFSLGRTVDLPNSLHREPFHHHWHGPLH